MRHTTLNSRLELDRSTPPSDAATSGTHRVGLRAEDAVTINEAPASASERPTVRVPRFTPARVVFADAGMPSHTALAIVSPHAIAVVTMDEEQVRQQRLDPSSAFVLGLLDGRTTIESVMDACPLSPSRVLRILGELMTEGIIDLR